MSLLGADASEPLPISLVGHTVFCPRRAWLEAAGERVDSYQMEVGSSAHRRVDDPTSSRPTAQRSVDAHHAELGIVGKCDIVEGDPAQGVQVIEYKASPVRRQPTVTDPHRIQLTLQRMCLESMGLRVASMGVYFTNHQSLVTVEPSTELDTRAIDYVSQTRAIVEGKSAPPPLDADEKCRFCSHASVCLPDEITAAKPARSISVTDPNTDILHLLTYGSRAQLRQGRIQVVKGDEELASVPLERAAGLVIYGNIDVSGALVRELLWRGATIVWCSGTGRVIGWSRSAKAPHGHERVAQYLRSEQGDLGMAREFVACKIGNQATLLRRNGTATATAVADIRKVKRRAGQVRSLPDLFAVEGEAAALYFAGFPGMFKERADQSLVGEWDGRAGRHASDPLNAALNFVYGMLLSDTIRAIVACGLDPSAGFLHSSARNKPALALDLMEEFRAPIADSAIIGAVNNGSFDATMVTRSLGDCRLTERGRKVVTSAYERRAQTVITHPEFGYRVTWRRAIEIQARMVLAVLDGTRQDYRGVQTR
ncbi:CRISPR-associated endonuclease Cas1 [Raineyella sp. W15-4]|uniref:CRISPR-associated endonuclease Cas1 n=1 Tax=Raineyella sp. W15-4 TaxID=3081651 RepID=UPI00295391E1|nr:CRISPR-associated endonuclease Cas1 [Raineyella sp. W15-4]WOQ16527.1 CRISPR-associated endonuclease Cas1 [Raineyella sp. W15-4]